MFPKSEQLPAAFQSPLKGKFPGNGRCPESAGTAQLTARAGENTEQQEGLRVGMKALGLHSAFKSYCIREPETTAM